MSVLPLPRVRVKGEGGRKAAGGRELAGGRGRVCDLADGKRIPPFPLHGEVPSLMSQASADTGPAGRCEGRRPWTHTASQEGQILQSQQLHRPSLFIQYRPRPSPSPEARSRGNKINKGC